jgi:hypothetical protein
VTSLGELDPNRDVLDLLTCRHPFLPVVFLLRQQPATKEPRMSRQVDLTFGLELPTISECGPEAETTLTYDPQSFR